MTQEYPEISVLYAFLSSRFTPQNGEVSIVDHMASSHNAQIDALLLVGLVAVTLGSTVVAAALISRTFCSRPEEPPYPFRLVLLGLQIQA